MKQTNYVGIKGFNLVVRARTLVKEEKHVTLLGMIHMGPKTFYDSICATWGSERYTTLSEGVNSGPKLWSDKLASVAGLELQRTTALFYNLINSDLDYSDFTEVTKTYITQLAVLVEELLSGNKRAFEGTSALTFGKQHRDHLHQEIVIRRNLVVYEAILASTSTDILVPWGAAHLPDLEERLKASGFTETNTTVIKYASLFAICRAFWRIVRHALSVDRATHQAP